MTNIVRVGVACIIKKQPNLILIGQRKGSHGVSKIQLPGGHLEFGEQWEQCCAREVKEETGLEVSHSSFFACTNDYMEQDGKHYITIFMLAELKDPEQEPQNLEPHKNEFWRWIEWDELRSNEQYKDNLFLPLHNLVNRVDQPSPFTNLN